MNHNRWQFDPVQVPDEVEVTETFPDRLLYLADDPERCQVGRFVRVRKIARDAQLESALPIRLGIALAQSRGVQLVAQFLDLRAPLTTREFCLELLPILSRQGCRIDECDSRWRWILRVSPLLDHV